MFIAKNKIIFTFLSLILLIAIAASSVGFSGFDEYHSQNLKQAELDLSDSKIADKEDCEDPKEKFVYSNLDKVFVPSLEIDLAQLNTNHLTKEFFLSVPISPPNS